MRKRESVEACPFFSSLTNECKAAQRAAEAKKRSDLDLDKKTRAFCDCSQSSRLT